MPEGKAHTSFLFQGVTENTVLQTSRNAMTTSSSSLKLRERRDAIVQEHIAAEKAHDIPRTIATFHRPRYELAPFCSVSDGDQAVHDLLDHPVGNDNAFARMQRIAGRIEQMAALDYEFHHLSRSGLTGWTRRLASLF